MPWSDEDRANAVALVAEFGPSEAARRSGVPYRSISRWAAQAGVASCHREKVAGMIESGRLRWEEHRLEIAEDAGGEAELALAKLHEALLAGNSMDAQRYATTMAIVIDKAQLLTGSATSRTEHGDVTPDRVRELQDEVRAQLHAVA